MGGLVLHYEACMDAGIKPILGNEVYFQPKFKPVKKSFHLCLFAKNKQGYRNLNKIVTYASKEQFYYKPIVDFELLKKYHKGLICSAACVGGYIPQLINNDNFEKAERVALKFQEIFGEDFYFEIQPFKLTEEGLQEKVNKGLIQLSQELEIPCIITSDSHFGSPEDFDTYLKMHEIAGHRDFGYQYEERYIPSEKEVVKRFLKMHGKDTDLFEDLEEAKEFVRECLNNIQEIVSKVDDDIFSELPLKMPVYDENVDSKELLWQKIKQGLKRKGKAQRAYVERCKEEYEVIVHHGFEDYFLMVQDYVNWARNNDIAVGFGRGSACNSLVAFALDITDVDSLFFGLEFRRFLRMDKKSLPDVDVDFETDERGRVIEYLLEKYGSSSARICSYGLYKVDNLLNDLFKVCGLAMADKTDEHKKEKDAETILIQKEIKKVVKNYIDEDGNFDYNSALMDNKIKWYNKKYDNIIKHFSKLYQKIRFYGTHAAGVAITGGNLLSYSAIERRAKETYTTSYDLNDIEKINVIKFDMLGLRTMSILKELRKMTGRDPQHFDYSLLEDEEIFEQFRVANTDGIFQYETKGAKKILTTIQADNYNDVIAVNALNRPAPLSMGMVDMYAEAKKGNIEKNNMLYPYAKETYGTFIYQEQVMKACVELGGMEWTDADKVMKFMKAGVKAEELEERQKEVERIKKQFSDGAVKHGYKRKEAEQAFQSMLMYLFNQGHATAYALIGIEQMYYKVHHNSLFWYVTLKYANEKDIPRLSAKAVKDGTVILLPHVNGFASHSLIKIDGDECIREGLSKIKGVGEKAAKIIEMERKENGDYEDYDDFLDRMEQYGSIVNKRVLEILYTEGAIDFNKKRYFNRCYKYNSALYGRANSF